MDDNFSPKVRDVITFSKEEALRLGHEFIGTEHLLLGLIRKGEGKAIEILTAFDVDLVLLRKKLEQLNPSNPSFIDNTDKPSLRLTRQAEKALKTTFLEAKLYQSESIDTAHLLLCILRNENDPTTKLIQKYNVNYDDAKALYKQLHVDDTDLELPSNPIAETPSDDEFASEKSNPFDNTQKGKNVKKSKTPVLDNFGRDLTDLAEKGKLDPVVGRQKEIERVSQILSRRKKNNPMLIGEPGVGKSAIAEGLALRIVERKVSRILFDKRLVSLDLASLVAGTKYRGQFEERMKALMNELEKNDDIILFIDEIHTIVGAGGATGSLDASNMLKPALARGEIQCIGATTLDEFRTNIEKDGALERRFQKVIVDPTSVEETIQILQNIKSKYEEHHNVDFTDDAIEACVKLTNRYMTDRYLPDKAIDALDEAGSRIHITNIVVPKQVLELEAQLEIIRDRKTKAVNGQKYEEAAKLRDDEKNMEAALNSAQNQWEEDSKLNREIVTEDNVAEVVSMMTGIPVNRVAEAETHRLHELPDLIKGKVIGQNEDGSWYNIRLDDGREGWMASRFIRVENTPTPFPTFTASPDLTALFLGTPLPPTELISGGATATPPSQVQTGTAVSGRATVPPIETEGALPGVPTIDNSAIFQTATALAGGISSPTSAPATDVATEERVITVENTAESPTASNSDVATATQATPASATPSGRTIRVFAFCDSPQYGAVTNLPVIRAGDTVLIWWGWFAGTEDQVLDHIEASTLELAVNGEAIPNANSYVGEVEVVGGSSYVAYWEIPFGPIESGEYLITYQVTWDSAIYDGTRFYGPETAHPFEQETCTFTVN